MKYFTQASSHPRIAHSGLIKDQIGIEQGNRVCRAATRDQKQNYWLRNSAKNSNYWENISLQHSFWFEKNKTRLGDVAVMTLKRKSDEWKMRRFALRPIMC